MSLQKSQILKAQGDNVRSLHTLFPTSDFPVLLLQQRRAGEKLMPLQKTRFLETQGEDEAGEFDVGQCKNHEFSKCKKRASSSLHIEVKTFRISCCCCKRDRRMHQGIIIP